MKKNGLSVIIPVYNSKDWIRPTLEHLVEALEQTAFDAEIIVVDDGSTDGSASVVKSFKSPKHIPLRLIKQANSGRYIARKKGVEVSTKSGILFIDSRVFADKYALKYLEDQLVDNPDQIWNGHVNSDKKSNIFARFWDAIVFIGWRKYFRKPKRTSYGIEEFDFYPKGTTFIYMPKKRLLAAMEFFEETTNDIKYSSDDTLLIRYMAERQKINLSPEFSCVYHARTSFKGFLKHAYFRGQFFIDGFLRKGTRFYYPLQIVLMLSVLVIIALIAFAPYSIAWLVLAALLFSLSLFLGALILGVPVRDSLALGFLSIPFLGVYLAGLWTGVARKVQKFGVRGVARHLWSEVKTHRRILRGSLGEYMAAALAYLGIAALLTKGVLFNISDQIYATIGDATAGFMWLNYVEPGLDILPSYTDDVNYPVGESVGGPTFITYMAIWIPIRIASYFFGPIAGLNIVMYLGFVSSAMASYWLVKRITGKSLIAFFSGLAVAFTPYALYKSSGHIAYIFSGAFILILAAFVAITKKPTTVRALLLAVAIALAFYTDGYFVLLASVMVIGLIVAGVVYGLITRFTLKEYVDRLKYLLVSLGALLILLVPVAVTQVYQGGEVKHRLDSARSDIKNELTAYRSNVVDFMLPSEYHPFFSQSEQFEALNAYKNQRSNRSENTNYIGFTLIVLSVLGGVLLVVRLVSRKYSSLKIRDSSYKTILMMYIAAITTVPLFLAFMFSPEVHVAGVTIKLPGQIFIDHNINLWRVMSRFYVPLHAIFAVVASLGLYVIYRTVVPTSKASMKRRVAGVLLVLGASVLLMFEFAANIPNRPYSFSKNMPSAYAWMAQQSDIKVVAELPFVDPLDERTAGYVSAQIIHGKKLVNMKDPNPARLSNTLGDEMNIETFNFLRERQVDTIVTRGSDCAEKQWGVLRFESDLESKKTPKLCVYQLRQIPLSDVDDAFVVYDKGFNPSPNAPDQSEVVLNDNEAYFQVKEADLQTDFKDIKDGVAISGVLKNNSNRSFQWMLLSGETVIQQGTVASGSESVIAVTVRDNEMKLVLQDENYALSEATFANVRVDDL